MRFLSAVPFVRFNCSKTLKSWLAMHCDVESYGSFSTFFNSYKLDLRSTGKIYGETKIGLIRDPILVNAIRSACLLIYSPIHRFSQFVYVIEDAVQSLLTCLYGVCFWPSPTHRPITHRCPIKKRSQITPASFEVCGPIVDMSNSTYNIWPWG